MIASTTLGTHNPRISAQTVKNCLREICERPPYIMYVLYAAFLFWPSIYRSQTVGELRILIITNAMYLKQLVLISHVVSPTI